MMHHKKLDVVKFPKEGVMLVKKFDSEFPKKYFKEFLEYINLNESELGNH